MIAFSPRKIVLGESSRSTAFASTFRDIFNFSLSALSQTIFCLCLRKMSAKIRRIGAQL
jgi:hypothetical protein